MSFYCCLLAGFLSGLLGGMGMGGGTLLIPVLTLLFGVPQLTAQQINLVSFLPMAICSLPVHFAGGLIRKKDALPILPSALLSGVAFSFLSSLLGGRILRVAFGIFLCLLSLWSLGLFIKSFTKRKKDDKIKKL